MSDTKVGYSLLVCGVFIMIVSVVYILLVFTGKKDPIELFNIPAPTFDMSVFMPDMSTFGSNLSLSDSKMEIIPTDQFNKLLNLSVTFFLMGFILTFGFKIATLGVMFLRPIKVSLKEEKTQQPPQTPQT